MDGLSTTGGNASSAVSVLECAAATVVGDGRLNMPENHEQRQEKQQFLEMECNTVNGGPSRNGNGLEQDYQRTQISDVTNTNMADQGSSQTKGSSSCFIDVHKGRPIRLQVKVVVPVRDHPNFNFVGKLLGPKGNSLKRLQEDTHTRMAILGRGSMRDKAKEEELRHQGDPKHSHLNEDLHVEITAFAPAAEAYARMAHALTEIKRFLVPDYYDDIRQNQLRELALMNEDRRKANGQPGTERSISPIINPESSSPPPGMVTNSHVFNTGRPTTLPAPVAATRTVPVRGRVVQPPPPMATVPRPNPVASGPRGPLPPGGVSRVPVARPGRVMISSVSRTPMYRKPPTAIPAISPKESRAALVPDEDCYMYDDGYGVDGMGDIYEDDYITISDPQYLDYEDPYNPRTSEEIHENGSFTNYGEEWKLTRSGPMSNGRLKASPPSRIVMRNGHREPPYGPTPNSRF